MDQLDPSISVLRVARCVFLYKLLWNILQANSGDAAQTSFYVASDLGLRCLSMSHKKDARLIWVNTKYIGRPIVFIEGSQLKISNYN